MKHLLTGILAISTLSSSMLFAHGEDTPGPHKGFIRMPGAFHTELVPDGAKGVKVYLLDVAFRNPITKNSQVSAKLVSQGKDVDTTCTPQVDFFLCRLPLDLRQMKSGKFIVTAERDGIKGGPATYELPLKRK